MLSPGDGAMNSEGRALGTRPASRFERWTNTNITGVSSSRVAPMWALIASVLSIAAIVVGVAIVRSGPAAGALFAVGSIVLTVLFVSRWFVVTAKARRYLVTREDLGDWARLAMLAAFYVTIPIVAGLVLVIVALLAQAL